MKIFLQNRATNLYLNTIDEWVADEKHARAFSSSATALEFCQRRRLADVRILLRFDEKNYDIRIDIDSLTPATPIILPRTRPN